ncbi:ATP-binding cassette domain-containing protein [Dactylosporangium sp. CA-233914]|uniref:ATP-binding cassette domain-containing protein n=1 Tax=Dactylosporangium sp. CA-233914 TaxID=3239934 RepID=UPI003D948151
MTTSMLRLDGVSRRFGGLTALHEISLDLPAGARHAVIGPNGAGKSTLLNLIAGTLAPTTGTIVVDGRDVTRLPARLRARHGVGRSFQHPAVFRRLPVVANLALAVMPGPDDIPGPRDADGGARVLDAVGLTEYHSVPAGQLPYGLQRRLELAMALARRPRLLLLDEPSAGLDPGQIDRLTTLLANLDAQTTVLLVDHHLDLIWSLAQTVTVLHHGRHLATGTPDQVRADPAVRDAYLNPGGHPAATARPAPRTAPGPVLLRVRQLRAGYHGAPVLDGIDLDVHDGEAVAVLGRNGAGKTTLLDTIAGLHPAQGRTRIEWAGRPLPTRRPHLPARAGIALVPQGRRIFTGLTVREHLVCASGAGGRTAATPGQGWTVERVLDLLPGLGTRLHHPAQRLSGGEQQMLALARALLTQPRLLILDEPTEGLAPAIIAQLTDALLQLVGDGLAILVAEQNLAMATALADRLVVLDHGRIAMTATAGDLTQDGPRQRLHALLGVAGPVTPSSAPAPRPTRATQPRPR